MDFQDSLQSEKEGTSFSIEKEESISSWTTCPVAVSKLKIKSWSYRDHLWIRVLIVRFPDFLQQKRKLVNIIFTTLKSPSMMIRNENANDFQQNQVFVLSKSLKNMLEQQASVQQISIYIKILKHHNGLHMVRGGTAAGKPYLLKMVKLGLQIQNFVVVSLAPTGAAANTIQGQTIHTFLGMNNRPNVANPVRIDKMVKRHEGMRLAILNVFVSKISKSLLQEIRDNLILATNINCLNSGILTVYFGDFG